MWWELKEAEIKKEIQKLNSRKEELARKLEQDKIYFKKFLDIVDSECPEKIISIENYNVFVDIKRTAKELEQINTKIMVLNYAMNEN